MLKYLKKYWYFALLAPIFMLGEVAMDLVQPKMMATIIDDGVLGLNNNNVGDLSLVISCGLKMIGVVFLGGFFGVMSGVFANLCSQRFGNDIRKDCFKNIMSLSLEQTDKFSTGSLITRVTNDITQIQNMVNQCIRFFIRILFMIILGTVCLLSLNISFGKIILVVFPLVLIISLIFIYKTNPLYSVLQNKLDRINSIMQENVTGARIVKACVKEKYEKKRFSKSNDELIDTQLNVLIKLSYLTPLINIIMNVAVVLVINLGKINVQNGSMSPGDVMASVTYLSQILHSVTMVAIIFQTISRGNASIKRVSEVLNCHPAITDGKIFDDKASQKGSLIEFKNVSFAYPSATEDEILTDINLTISPGETFAILGETGCGKSSLVNLIPRFYDVTKGKILIDGIDVKDYNLANLREKIAIALQKSELFSVSIKENIMWGDNTASDNDINLATTIAQADEFIKRQPDDINTLVAEKGMSLSGGQKQRLSISRAILKNSNILIFDDSTSALDLKTEANLYHALNNNYKDVTKIIIAQRIASVKNADRIAVIDNGRIVSCGTHNELLKTSAIYQDIYNSQLKNGGDDNE